MKLKYTFELIEMDKEVVAVPVGRGANLIRGVLKLNNEGREILELLKEDTTEDQIVERLDLKYENDYTELAKFVHNTIDVLRKNGLIED